jgi:type IV pilus biogenesis protein CpaD/CtpE
MMKNLSTRMALACAMALLAVGCAQRTPYLESQMGQSLSLLKAQQVINPDAGSNTDPVAGIDARAAKSSQDRYQQSFRMPQPQPNVFNIGIGGR